MTAVCRCDLCERIDEVVEPDSRYCGRCQSRIGQMQTRANQQAFLGAKEHFGAIVASKFLVIQLLRELYDHRPDEFASSFGAKAFDLLEELCKKFDAIEERHP